MRWTARPSVMKWRATRWAWMWWAPSWAMDAVGAELGDRKPRTRLGNSVFYAPDRNYQEI